MHAITKGANIFTGHSGIWHLHYVHLAHYHMPQNTDCDPWGCVGVRQWKKKRINLTRSVCARCGDEVLCGAEMPFLDVCKWVRVNERKTAKSCTQTQGKWSFRSTLSPTMQKTRCGYLFLVELGFTHKFSWKCVLRGVHDQHSLTQLDQKKDTHASSCECPTITQTHVSSNTVHTKGWKWI